MDTYYAAMLDRMEMVVASDYAEDKHCASPS